MGPTRRLPHVVLVKAGVWLRWGVSASDFASGDQNGGKSAFLSLVSRRRPVPSTLITNRSESPPSSPLKTSCFPSGLQVGVLAAAGSPRGEVLIG